MRYFDGVVRVIDGFFVLMDLTEQSTDLHMGFALVLQHLQLQRWLFRIVEVLLHEVTLQVVNASF